LCLLTARDREGLRSDLGYLLRGARVAKVAVHNMLADWDMVHIIGSHLAVAGHLKDFGRCFREFDDKICDALDAIWEAEEWSREAFAALNSLEVNADDSDPDSRDTFTPEEAWFGPADPPDTDPTPDPQDDLAARLRKWFEGSGQ
jgi:hypothetical protein